MEKTQHVIPNLFRDPAGHSRLLGLRFACSRLFYRALFDGVLKQVQHDVHLFDVLLNQPLNQSNL